MKKRIISLLLAVLVLAAALPLGIIASAEGEIEGGEIGGELGGGEVEGGEVTPEEPVQFVVNRQKIVNNIPFEANKLLLGSSYANSDPGAGNNFSAYVKSGTDEWKVDYLIEDGAADGAAKITYNAAGATTNQSSILFFRKGVPQADSNVVGFYVDATALTNDPENDNDDFFRALIKFSTRADSMRVFAAGVDYYFLSDEEGAVLETIENPTAINDGEAYIKIFRGKSGYYYFPEEGFQNTTVENNGYEVNYSNANWTKFSDSWMQTEWVMDNGNFGNTFSCRSRYILC